MKKAELLVGEVPPLPHLLWRPCQFHECLLEIFSRVYSSRDENDKDLPLLLVVKQEKGILSRPIPFFINREDSTNNYTWKK